MNSYSNIKLTDKVEIRWRVDKTHKDMEPYTLWIDNNVAPISQLNCEFCLSNVKSLKYIYFEVSSKHLDNMIKFLKPLAALGWVVEAKVCEDGMLVEIREDNEKIIVEVKNARA